MSGTVWSPDIHADLAVGDKFKGYLDVEVVVPSKPFERWLETIDPGQLTDLWNKQLEADSYTTRVAVLEFRAIGG